MVTAIANGFKTSGTDINKVAYLITKVKSTPIDPIYLDGKIRQLLSRLNNLHEIKPLIPQNI